MQRLYLLSFIVLSPLLLNAQYHVDCAKAMDICKKQVYHVNKTGGEGEDDDTDLTACFMNGENHGQAEENSTWIRFEVAKSGTLTFAITPHRLSDDIDFVVYLLPDGNCQNKRIVRCMAAGDSEAGALSSPCMGETGLREGEKDTSEDAGCSDPGDNAWLAPLKVSAGEKYAILVSNVSSAGPGFSIRFSGSAKLPCDEEPKPIAEAPKPKEKPKPKPTPPPPPAPAPAASKPETIGGRAVEVDETVKVTTRKIKLKIWDSQVEDGDIVSIFLDDKKIIDHIYLRTKPQEYEITLPPGKKEYYLTVFADDFGKSEVANTATVVIFDGVREQTIDLVAGKSKQESVKIVME